jgi:hypothetical protein
MTQPDPALDAALRDGWSSACRLYEHLAAGGQLVPLPLGALRINPDEIQFGDAVLGYARYYGTVVQTQQGSTFWFGSPLFVAGGLAAESLVNAAARRQAEAMAAARWRDHARVRTALTSKRFLCDYAGTWLNFWHEGVQEITVDLSRWAFVLRYEVGEPLMIHGPAAPWFAVAAARIIYGPRGLTLPAFGPLAHAAAQRQRSRTIGAIKPLTGRPR